MPRITISYRRADSDGITGRIFDRLVARYGAGNVFMDTDGKMPVGVDFRHFVEMMLRGSEVVLAIVSPAWAGPRQDGVPRIMEPNDPVRVEIAMAMRLGLAIVPVLVGGAKMPPSSALPEDIREFAFLHAPHVESGEDFFEQMRRLIRALDDTLAARRSARAQAKRQAREDRKRDVAMQPATASPPLDASRDSPKSLTVVLIAFLVVTLGLGVGAALGVVRDLSTSRAGPTPSPVVETASPDVVAEAGGNGERFHRPMPAGFGVLSDATPGLYSAFLDCKPAGDDADVQVEIVNDYRQTANFDISLRPTSSWSWPWDRDWLRERPHILPGARWRTVHRVKGLDCSRSITTRIRDLRFGRDDE